MTDQQDLPDWALDRARALRDLEVYGLQAGTKSLQALARYIAQHEEPPVNPLLIEARKLIARTGYDPAAVERGEHDDMPVMAITLAALRRGVEIGQGLPVAQPPVLPALTENER